MFLLMNSISRSFETSRKPVFNWYVTARSYLQCFIFLNKKMLHFEYSDSILYGCVQQTHCIAS